METVTIKPGSIIMWKDYSSIRVWWSKLCRKELPFNYARIYDEQFTIAMPISKGTLPGNLRFVVLEPRKQYSKVERELLRNMYVFDSNSLEENLAITVNSIRPETFEVDNLTLDNLMNNKYYRVVYDSSTKS